MEDSGVSGADSFQIGIGHFTRSEYTCGRPKAFSPKLAPLSSHAFLFFFPKTGDIVILDEKRNPHQAGDNKEILEGPCLTNTKSVLSSYSHAILFSLYALQEHRALNIQREISLCHRGQHIITSLIQVTNVSVLSD
jgi:hypothetical protein